MKTNFIVSLAVVIQFLAIAMLPAGEVEFLVGDYLQSEDGVWQPQESPLKRPFGVDFDSAGRMYVVELEGGRVFRLDPDRTLHHISGDGSASFSGDGGPFSAATFNGMHNCAITNDDQLLIADSWNHRVRRVDLRTGEISTLAGNGAAGFAGDGGPAAEASFDFVMCISLNPASNRLHIADLRNRRIRTVEFGTGIVRTIAGNGLRGVPRDGAPAVAEPLQDPRAVAEDSLGNVYVLERGGHALRVVRPDGTINTVAGNGERGLRDGSALDAQLASPKHICIDDRDRVFIADDQNAAIRLFDPRSGLVTTVLGRGFGDPRITLKNPHGVSWHAGWLYVVDTGHNRILRMRVAEGQRRAIPASQHGQQTP
jgi:hypothetical protein